jgi:hypothetical protein
LSDGTDSHGGFADAEIDCEGPDSGELVIPGEILDIFDEGNRGRGECGSHTFDRYQAANPEADTTVRLESVGPGGLYYSLAQSRWLVVDPLRVARHASSSRFEPARPVFAMLGRG